MRKHERGRRTPGAALALAVAGGAMLLALGGCGQSGPLYLPEKASRSAVVPLPGPVPSAIARRREAPRPDSNGTCIRGLTNVQTVWSGGRIGAVSDYAFG